MIALLLAATVFTHTFSQPVMVEWRVRWNPPLKSVTHKRKFKTASKALKFSGAAPMCMSADGRQIRPSPCVEWIKVYLVPVEPWIKEVKR